MAKSKQTILLSGMVAGDPHQGGATWSVLQYWLGLERLGHDVYFVEPVKETALQPGGASLSESTNSAYFREVCKDFALGSRGAILREGTRETVGVSYEELRQAARRADVLINIAGMLTDDELMADVPIRVYLDFDPAFTQLWHLAERIDMRWSRHNRFVTVGQAIGTDACTVPTGGERWIPTWQPVVLAHWPPADQVRWDALTTIGNWRGYGSIIYKGEFYGQKAHSLRPFMALPRQSRRALVLAMAIHPGEQNDLAALAENGWRLLDPVAVAGTPARYQQFIQGSWAEFGIAKKGYVASACGWFSDRSACYLASGRPVLAQETGFSRFLPCGTGLLPFQTVEDALAGIAELERDYSRHCRAARAIAEELFDSDKVLGRLLDMIGAGT